MSKLSSKELKEKLWEVFLGVREGAITPEQANAMARAAKVIVDAVYLDIHAASRIDLGSNNLKEYMLPVGKSEEEKNLTLPISKHPSYINQV